MAVFPLEDLAGQLLFAVLEAANGQGDLLLGPGGHLQELLLEQLQFFVERAFHLGHGFSSGPGPGSIRTAR